MKTSVIRAEKSDRSKIVAMSEFRRHPGEYLLDVRRDGWTIVLTQYGKFVAVLMPIEGAVTTDGASVA